MVNCGKSTCKEASRAIKSEKLREISRKGWESVARVSNTEIMLKEPLEKIGWLFQYKYITGLTGKRDPKKFWLDFAKLDKKLCLEIDGSVHRHSNVIIKDRRRDEILRSQGWQVLRIESKLVMKDLDTIVAKVSQWDAGSPPCESFEPEPKFCEVCRKPVKNLRHRFCSTKCKIEDQHGKPLKMNEIRTPRKKNYIPCRICGEPTKIQGTPKHPRWGKKACIKPKCQAASRIITNQNQSAALKGNIKLKNSITEAWYKRRASKEVDTMT